MRKEIVINSSTSQNRLAIIEDGKLVDFFIDHHDKDRMVGDIYYGRIARVLPGIRAAFVDINMKHDAFLHFSDIGDRMKELQAVFDDDDEDGEKPPQEKPQAEKQENVPSVKEKAAQLHKGQEILVQIIKEPVKDKGVRVTSSISIPGRFCVLIPYDNKVGISKKITDLRERKRLRRLAKGILPDNCGLIIRTAAKDQTEESLTGDLKYLVKTWDEIQENIKAQSPPALVYKDISTTMSVIRDMLTNDITNLYIDSKKILKEIKDYLQIIQPSLVAKVEFYRGSDSIFDYFKIEEQIRELMGRRVSLPAGGHIVIEHTEAMTVIDVNSGRYAAKKEQELNSLKTDLEAAREIVRQLRLRDIGGLIVVDFIDLEDDKNRKKIFDELKKEFRKDRAKIAMLPMTDFGLMQITRERIRENIVQSMNEVCPYCDGTGIMLKRSNLIHSIEDWLRRYRNEGKFRKIRLIVHPSLAKDLKSGVISAVNRYQLKYFLRIILQEDISLNPQVFKFISAKTGEDLTDDFI